MIVKAHLGRRSRQTLGEAIEIDALSRFECDVNQARQRQILDTTATADPGLQQCAQLAHRQRPRPRDTLDTSQHLEYAFDRPIVTIR